MPNLIDRRDGESTNGNQGTQTDSEAKKTLSTLDLNLSDNSLQSYWKTMIEKGFIRDENNKNGQVSTNGSEVIDIVTEYEWSLNKPTPTGLKGNIRPVPCVYAIEKFQRFGATATNFYNSIWAMKNVGKAVLGDASGIFGKITADIGEAIGSLGGNKGKGFINEVSTSISSFGTDESNFGKSLKSGDKGDLLSPYAHLYALGDTKKHFCFPYFGEGAAAWSLNNDFSSEGSKGLLSKAMMGTIDTLTQGLIDFAGDFQEISNWVNNNSASVGGFVMYNLEKAKAFSFPTTGKIISVRFPLFNTTKLDAWKDNYKFIVLFGFRNMLFRKDNVQYYPPMIYDVTIPGWGRMPYSYVKQFTVKPIGMMRTLSMENFVKTKDVKNGLNKITVNVPEAWVIQIDFMSLIADSGNQFLSSLIDLPITVAL